jgi:acyl carrier protein
VLDEDSVLVRLRSLLCERLDLDPAELQPGAALEDLGIDSVELAFIFSCFERDTGLDFEDAEIDVSRYETVGGVVDTLAAKVAAAPG